MSIIGKFLWYYLSAGFWGAHAMVWILATFILVNHRRDLSKLLSEARSDEALDSVRAAQRIEEAERRNAVYDLCSSVFILIGLLGTIWGFYKGMIQASSGRIPLDEIAPALSTSAFGIIWAIALNFLVVYVIEPRIEDIKKVHRDRVSTTLGIAIALEAIGTKLDASLMVVKETVEAINKELKTVFESGTKSFTDASVDMATAATALKESVTSSSESFKQSIADAAQTAKKLDTVLRNAMSLPEKVAAQLEQYAAAEAQRRESFFNQVSEKFRNAIELMAKQLQAMEQIPAAVRSEVVATQNSYVNQLTALTSSIAGYGEQLQRSLEGLYQTHEGLMSSAAAKVRNEFDSVINRMAAHAEVISQLPDRIRTEFDGSHKTYLEAVNQALRDYREFEELIESRLNTALSGYQQTLESNGKEADRRTAIVIEAFEKVIGRLEGLPVAVGESSRKLTDEYLDLLRQQQAADLARLAIEIEKVWKKAHGEMEAVRQKVESVTAGLTEVGGTVYREQQQKVSEEVKLLFFQMNQFVDGIHTTIAEALSIAPGEIQAKADAIKAEVNSLAAAASGAGQHAIQVTGEVRESIRAVEGNLQKLSPIVNNFRVAAEQIRTAATANNIRTSDTEQRPTWTPIEAVPVRVTAPAVPPTEKPQFPIGAAPSSPKQPQGPGNPIKEAAAPTVEKQNFPPDNSHGNWLERFIGRLPFQRKR